MSSLLKQFEELGKSSDSFDEGRKKAEPSRKGWGVGIPIGGATPDNIDGVGLDGAYSRQSLMEDLLQAYLSCTWVSASIDTIARTATAGGLEVIPVSGVYSGLKPVPATREVKKVQELLYYVNPYEDIRQLMRGVVTSLQIFGDSFTEVVWSRFGEPVALYQLDATTMNVLADEHGNVLGYYQETDTNKKAYFTPRDVIHVKFDNPGDTLYGASPTQKAIVPVTTWLFAATLLKETYRRGDPLRAWVDWPIALPESEMKRFQQQYHVRNLGPKNIGNLFETKGGAQVKELGTNQLQYWMQTLQERRDEILSSFGVPPSKVGIVEAGNIGGGSGTALALSTPIPTPSGWTTMGQLQVGDSVFDEKGKLAKVEKVFEVPNAESYRIHFSDGTSIDACADHLWTTWDHDARKSFGRSSSRVTGIPEDWINWKSSDKKNAKFPQVRTTKDILDTLKIGTRNNHSIPVSLPIDIPKADLLIDPYVLGAWLGDGTSIHGSISNNSLDIQIIEEIRSAGYVVNERKTNESSCPVYGIIDLIGSLKKLQVNGNKHIPDEYLRASIEQRLALLQGLMDTDGGWTGKCQVVFVNTNEKLADQVLELARSLGQKPVKAKRALFLNGIEHGPAYRITWTPTIQPFRLKRKANLFNPSTHGMRVWMRTIVGIEKIANVDMRCIQVSSASHLYLAGEGMIPTHNSQDKTFRVNTIGPIQEIILEKFSFALLYQAYGITDWTFKFGVVDWRDDLTIEQIRDMRIRNGSWVLDRARADIGEPPVPGGDKPVLIDRQNMVLWEDLNDLSKANLAVALSQANPNDGTGVPTPKTGVNAVKGPNTNPGATQKTGVKKPGQAATPQKAPQAPKATESFYDYYQRIYGQIDSIKETRGMDSLDDYLWEDESEEE